MGLFDKYHQEMESKRNNLQKLIGKCFQYKNNFNDKKFTYIRIIRIDIDNFDLNIICDELSFTDFLDIPDAISITRTLTYEDKLHNMTEIPEKEFEFIYKGYLKQLGLTRIGVDPDQ